MTERLKVEVWNGERWVPGRIKGMLPNTIFRMPNGGLYLEDYSENKNFDTVAISDHVGFQSSFKGTVEGDGVCKCTTFANLKDAITEQKRRMN